MLQQLKFLWILLICLTCSFTPLKAAELGDKNYATGPHIEVRLFHEHQALIPGQSTYLGVLFSPEEKWHTYWQNPGDSGEAPTIAWQTNDNLKFGKIRWPIPKPIPVAHLVNYGYEADNLLMVKLEVPATLVDGDTIEIKADVSWLVCKEDCIPGWASLQLNLPIAQNTQAPKPSQYSEYFTSTREILPQASIKTGLFEVNEDHIVFQSNELVGNNWQVFPLRSDLIVHAAEQNVLNIDNTIQNIIPVSPYFSRDAASLTWLISDGQSAYYVNGDLNTGVANSLPLALSKSLWVYVLMAFLGGLILNVMPCVLPILSIKAMALQHNQQSKAHKFSYMLGIAVCFNVFALIILALKLAGQQVGWGFHMQEPIVIIILAFLFTFIALVLFDVLMVGTRFSGVGQSLVEGNTAKSHFATGVLAVIVASPCTAPFMATALGIALLSEPFVTFVLFNALAFGFALPLSLLFVSSRVQSLLPKPGAWMETFKRALAFPMLATVAWLTWVYGGQSNPQSQFVLLLCLIFFAMFVWLLAAVNIKKLTRIISLVGLCVCLALPMYLAFVSPKTSNVASADTSLVYSPKTLQSLKDDNQIVLVNMTADWCITCKVNEQVALSNETVRNALAQDGVHYMLGDWTNKNTQILEYLSQYERSGVPLYVIYAGNEHKQVLPQILSPNTVVDAINLAKQELKNDQ